MPLSESDRYSRIKTARAIPPSTSNQVVRIGDRDPQTGLHKTLDACGNEALNGEKIFSASHQSGDIVRVTRAGGSNLLQLDSINARSPVQERSILGDNCPGYFNGQIFSCEEELKKRKLEPWLLRQEASYGDGIYRFSGPALSAGYVSSKQKTNNFKISLDFRFNVPTDLADWEFANIFVFTSPFEYAISSNIVAPITRRSDFAGDFDFQISIFSATIFGINTVSSIEYTHFEFKYDGSVFSGIVGSTPFSTFFSTPVADYIGIGASMNSFVDVPGIEVKNFKYNNQLIVPTNA